MSDAPRDAADRTPEPCTAPDCCGDLDRRQFVKLGAAGLAALGLSRSAVLAGPFGPEDTIDHFVPKDKKLSAEWLESLFAKGQPESFQGDDLKTIGMPVGGVAAGQVYVTGDGRLVYWGIFNQNINSGFGAVNYTKGLRLPTEMVVNRDDFVPAPAVEQGVAVRVETGERTMVRTLTASDFPQVRFRGEYPIARIDYEAAGFPLAIQLEAFSPFIPLNAADSGLPATVLQYTLRNRSDAAARVTLAGWLQNAVLHYGAEFFANRAVRVNRLRQAPRCQAVQLELREVERPLPEPRPAILLADFEGDDYGDWQSTGEAFGERPARGTLPGQQRVSGYRGQGLVNSFLGGNDQQRGRLVSPAFRINRHYLSFLIGGGAHDDTVIQLIVDDQVVHRASGKNRERLEPCNWNVREYEGQQARLEIIDEQSGGWGHINIDHIELRDTPTRGPRGELADQPDFGTMALALVADGEALSSAALPEGKLPDGLFDGEALACAESREAPLSAAHRGALARQLTLAPGETKTVTFIVSWHMPNMYFRDQRVGNHYATRFRDAAQVAEYVVANRDRLARDTRLWRDTYYDSTLPCWLLDRLHSTVANLATTTCQWWGNGRFWAYEGCGCCHGTCGHVWNYEHALARLFPALERSVREMQDFAPGVGFVAETGAIRFRGESWDRWAGDAQGGYILKAYREHLVSGSNAFLQRNWRNIRKAIEFLIQQDGNADGLIEGRQHQTYDQDYYGANTMVGSLYLGALRAAEEMARVVGEADFADQCRQIFEAGSRNSVRDLFNGEYYIQEVDLEKHPKWQYADGCLSDQMFGQGWAHQVGLGYLYPRPTVLKALESVWKYNWAPDVGRQNEAHPPQRWFAYPGEAGLFTCTWPRSHHLGPQSTVYRDEVWTGIEYQVANHMAYEGMLTEALALCRAVHERYHPSKRNPYNEIECGDHYARALASWGVLLGLAGFTYDGPRRRLGFAPRMTPDAFRCVFTTAEGWGTLDQRRMAGGRQCTVEVKWGQVPLDHLSLDASPQAEVRRITLNGQPLTTPARITREGSEIQIEMPQTITIPAGQTLRVEMTA